MIQIPESRLPYQEAADCFIFENIIKTFIKIFKQKPRNHQQADNSGVLPCVPLNANAWWRDHAGKRTTDTCYFWEAPGSVFF